MKIEVELTSGKREVELPLRIVSDWHMGHPASRVGSVERMFILLEGVGTLIMAGDGREELVVGWRQQADEMWDELLRACEERGIEVISLTGNHDPDVSEEGWLLCDEGRIFVTHGDLFYETASPWSCKLFAFREEVTAMVKEARKETLEDRWRLAVRIGRFLRPAKPLSANLLVQIYKAVWPPDRLLAIRHTWADFPRQACEFVDCYVPGVETVVCGHFHRMGDFRRGGKRVLNLGAMHKFSRAAVVDFDGESLEMKGVREFGI
ncbi:MAG: metallophosphoesterase [Verrucomicrobiota bacterium]